MKKEEKLNKTDKAILFGLLAGITGFWILIGLCVVPNVLVSQFFKGPGKEYKHLLYNEARGIRMAEEALEGKYGEEFIVHDVWSKASHEFFAACSPKENEKVVFLAAVWKDGEGIVYDEYLQGVVDSQIKDQMENELSNYYDNFFVKTAVSTGLSTGVSMGNNVFFESTKDVTPEEYTQKAKPRRCLVVIGIDFKKEQGNLQKEYEFFSEIMQDKINGEEIPPLYVVIYDMDYNLQEWCKDYFRDHPHGYAEYTTHIYKCNKMEFECMKDGINVTYEEFKALREEPNQDE